jgi:hypothetical protein
VEAHLYQEEIKRKEEETKNAKKSDINDCKRKERKFFNEDNLPYSFNDPKFVTIIKDLFLYKINFIILFLN